MSAGTDLGQIIFSPAGKPAAAVLDLVFDCHFGKEQNKASHENETLGALVAARGVPRQRGVFVFGEPPEKCGA
jgi:hypothetical protein